jgi:hypothetical protein
MGLTPRQGPAEVWDGVFLPESRTTASRSAKLSGVPAGRSGPVSARPVLKVHSGTALPCGSAGPATFAPQ